MTKNGHNIIGVSLAATLYCIDHNLWIAGGALLGATAPDALEMSYFDKLSGRFKRVIPHRTITHSPWLWLGILYCTHHYSAVINSVTPFDLTFLIYGYIYGVASHLLADIGTPMGIPLLNPFGKRFSFNFYKTGSGEWRVLIPTILAALGLSYSLTASAGGLL